MKTEYMIEYDDKEYKKNIPQKDVVAWVDSVLKKLDKSDFFLSIVFTDNDRIREINKEFRGKNNETDVLSFSQIEGDDFGFENKFLGDVVIAVPYTENQAKELGHDLFTEVKYLILHGILHLLGYDHDENEEGEMSMLEKKIYNELTGDEIE